MTADERDLWHRLRKGNDDARRDLIVLYLPLVDLLARRLARITGVFWEDLRQEGAIGLMKALIRFDPNHGAPFRVFAKQYIHGAMLDGSDVTRDVARRQEENYRKVRETEERLTQAFHRNPSIEEVANESGLTTAQIRNRN